MNKSIKVLICVLSVVVILATATLCGYVADELQYIENLNNYNLNNKYVASCTFIYNREYDANNSFSITSQEIEDNLQLIENLKVIFQYSKEINVLFPENYTYKLETVDNSNVIRFNVIGEDKQICENIIDEVKTIAPEVVDKYYLDGSLKYLGNPSVTEIIEKPSKENVYIFVGLAVGATISVGFVVVAKFTFFKKNKVSQ